MRLLVIFLLQDEKEDADSEAKEESEYEEKETEGAPDHVRLFSLSWMFLEREILTSSVFCILFPAGRAVEGSEKNNV